MTRICWIGAYPAQSGLHLWAFDEDDTILREGRAEGLDAAAIDAFAGGALPVIAAGLGVCPRPVPCAPLDAVPALDLFGEHPRLAAIAPLSQSSPGARTAGEETAIAGFLRLNSGFDGVLCLPGPVQTLWAHISAAEVVSLQPFATPRLAAALGADGPMTDFDAAVADTLSRPERLAAYLADPARGCTWGHLIGAELAAARPWWLGQQLAVIGTGPMAGHYADALAGQGLSPVMADGQAMILKGLAEARRRAGL
ncbi:2-dehydro-3-deoxygalactonokinase [Rhodovulum bhavnagarense]|uniref:2-dehydro-3-deoxygalactonokinase n=1 Tax=Rhodovulum bhavnagarense TaxID=992286 RepID=A0A4R2RSB1_9RHOB|nr:2-dehydro-3-deoxygalactonokinase [Rhodovulum bhavnagarense]TCP62781.1 2-dehydro-3-deoxygalactonokinase [Rhodovulum bhavnagarense]